jgi:hypothetical protein
MINIVNIAFEGPFKVDEDCWLWKCTEKNFSQRPDAQVSIGNQESSHEPLGKKARTPTLKKSNNSNGTPR